MIDKIEHNNNPMIPKSSGFDVPKGYFDSVEDDFSIRLKEGNLPGTSGYKVPDGYFESLEDKILSQVTDKPEGKVIPLRTRILRFASVAAVFVFIFISIWNNAKNEEDLTSDEIASWIEVNISDIDLNDIYNELDEDVEFMEVDLLENSIENNSIDTYFDQNDTYILIEESQGLFDEIN